MRPNIHIQDMTDLYVYSLQWPDAQIDGKVFNAGYENKPVAEIAEIVRRTAGQEVQIVTTPTDDMRSYHISSEKIKRELDFVPRHTIEEAVQELIAAFRDGRISDPMNNIRYYNIKTMQDLGMK